MILIDIGWFSFIGGCQIGHLRFSTLCKFASALLTFLVRTFVLGCQSSCQLSCLSLYCGCTRLRQRACV